MADLATTSDFEAAWQPLNPGDARRVATWIKWASAVVRDEVPTVDARIANNTLDADLVASIVVAMVRRVIGNPDAAASTSETIGPFAQATTYSADSTSSGLFLTKREIERLRPAASRTFTITPGTP